MNTIFNPGEIQSRVLSLREIKRRILDHDFMKLSQFQARKWAQELHDLIFFREEAGPEEYLNKLIKAGEFLAERRLDRWTANMHMIGGVFLRQLFRSGEWQQFSPQIAKVVAKIGFTQGYLNVLGIPPEFSSIP